MVVSEGSKQRSSLKYQHAVDAETPRACFDQLVFMMQQAGSTSSEKNLRAYIQSIIPIVIQLKRNADPARFVEIAEVYFDAE